MLYFAGPGDDYLYLCLALYCLVMGSVTSYARARAESLGMDAKGGLAERADRLVAILVMTFFGDLLGPADPLRGHAVGAGAPRAPTPWRSGCSRCAARRWLRSALPE